MEYVALIVSVSTLHYRGGSSTEYFKKYNNNTTLEVKWILHLSINTHFEKLDDKIGIQLSLSCSSDVWGRIIDQSHTCPCLSLEWCFHLQCYRSGKKSFQIDHIFHFSKWKCPFSMQSEGSWGNTAVTASTCMNYLLKDQSAPATCSIMYNPTE